MKEHSFLFTTDMVQAILKNYKEHTRRIISPHNSYFDGGPVYKEVKEDWENFDWDNAWVDPGPSPAGNPGPYLKVFWPRYKTVHRIYPRYQVGDLFYVKETWANDGVGKNGSTYDYIKPSEIPTQTPLHYKASISDKDLWRIHRWRPSICMPKKFARIWAQVESVVPERLQNISPADIRNEGISTSYPADMNSLKVEPMIKQRWIDLWDKINKKRGYEWASNPLVWAVAFRRITPTHLMEE